MVVSLQFSSGTLGGEVLAFVETKGATIRLHLIDPASFEIEETLDLEQRNPLLISNSYDPRPIRLSALFFDPDGEIMYIEWKGTLYEWTLQAREGPAWWLGEGYHA